MGEVNKRIQASIQGQRAVGLKGDSWDNHAVAHETLQDELGYSGADRPHYHLDERTRDILLAHARQDAAHALANTSTLLKRVQELNRVVHGLVFALVTAGIALAFFLWKIVQHSQL